MTGRTGTVFVFVVSRGADGFVLANASEKEISTRNDASRFTVAVVRGDLDSSTSMIAYRCDFIAMYADATLSALPNVLKRRAVASIGDVKEGEPMRGDVLHAYGVVAMLVDGTDASLERRLIGSAGTMLALKQARPFTCVDWFDSI